MKEDQIELKKFSDAFRERFPQFGDPVVNDAETEFPEDGTDCEVYFNTFHLEFRVPDGFRFPRGKHLVQHAYVHVSLHTHVNKNGITGPDDIARTYDIGFTIKGDVRHYRCRRFEETDIWKRYAYNRVYNGVLISMEKWLRELPEELADKIQWKGEVYEKHA